MPAETTDLSADLRKGAEDFAHVEVGDFNAGGMCEAAADKIERLEQDTLAVYNAAIRRAAQIAADQHSDNPKPGTWNEACAHIAAEIGKVLDNG